MADTEARFSILIGGNAPQSAAQTGDAIESMRQRIVSGEASIGKMSEALRRLKGSSAEVKAEKVQLKAKIDAEQGALGKLTAEALKSGVSVEQLSTKTKTLTGDSGAAGAAIGAIGGPVSAASGKLDQLKAIMGNGSASAGMMRLALVGVVAVLLAVAAASAGVLVGLAKFAVEGANAARSADLMRQAVSNNAQDAKNLGSQVDALAGKVSTSKEALNELAVGLARNGLQGQALVDTFNAVGQASAAMGDEAGNKIRGLIEAGRQSQRLFLSRETLVGTGVSFEEVAKSLSSQMKVGVGEAKAALAEGRVGLGVGAAAIKDAVEKKFGAINAAKMLDINEQAKRFRQNLTNLTSGIKLEPLLKGLEKITSLFDEGTVTGSTLKTLMTMFGDTLSNIFGKIAPVGAQFFKGLVIGGLTLTVAVLKLRKGFTETFGDTSLFSNVDWLKTALFVGETAVYAFGTALAVLAALIAPIVLGVAAGVAAIQLFGSAFTSAYNTVKAMSWSEIGIALVQGLVDGIAGMGPKAIASILGLATSLKDTVKNALGIHSPSKVFEGYGKNTAEGFAGGIDAGAPAVEESAGAMAPGAPGGGGGARGGGGGPVTVNVTINLGGGGGDAAKALTDPGFLAQLVKVFQEAAIQGGLALAGAP